MIDSLSHAVANAIQATMIASYRDTFNQIVVPSFEKAATNMFQQTNDVFKRGTKECLLIPSFFIFFEMKILPFRFTRND
jgi:hypothetical protein